VAVVNVYDVSFDMDAPRFDAWVRSIDAYSGDDLLYLNPKGIIPAAAVFKRSERRKKPFRERKRFDVTDLLENSKAEVDEVEDEEEEEGVIIDKAKLVDMEG
jgi:tRNA pseudouridine38-40 synthase